MPLTGKIGLAIGTLIDQIRVKMPTLPALPTALDEIQAAITKIFRYLAALSTADLADGTTGTGTIVLNTTPTFEEYIDTPLVFTPHVNSISGALLLDTVSNSFDITLGAVLQVRSTGRVKFTTMPPIYANNAAAVTGGLGIGEVYRTGGDPDSLSIVH